ncbi:unnamed protein product [Ceutorhynchus assimilis]|uniref:Uncharacterized protein n=1 Tax=Ceutorhynchus assimilis TaxID=467358 RepID=A0A9N9QSJ8_9CUCU|nr:unnamed protein product [Ceutorhynchus assimilis]
MSDSEDDSNEKQLKVVVLGDSSVGKTNLIKRFCYDEYSRSYTPTIGADFYIKRITLAENKEINIRITDVSGSELNKTMFATYLFKADMIFLVYDITKSESFDSLISWLRKIDEVLDNRTIFIAVIGNKCDLEHKRSVRLDKTNSFITDNKLSNNYFVSARTGENVNSSFVNLISKYFNLPLDKQRPIIKAELVPTMNRKIQRRKVMATNQSCMIQ